MQDGFLAIKADGGATLFVRKSYERARMESPLADIVRIESYKDAAARLGPELGRTYVETEIMPLAMLDRIGKRMRPSEVLPLDRILLNLRAVKDQDEIALMEESGRQHAALLERTVPALLREGMSECDLATEIYAAMVKAGHHGLSRFGMFQMELIVGQVAFGTNSLYPTNFDGPGGMSGLHPAVPVLGSRERKLAAGDLVFVDVGYGVTGYHTDKTQVYSFRARPSEKAVEIHGACRAVLSRALSLLKPGASAASVYRSAVADLPASLSRHFMGYGEEGVKFLGHGIGLQVDEMPVIMDGNETALEPGMTIALEPKCGVEGQGLVGVEESYLLTADGPRCLTGGDRDIMVVD
jgi:Xaa-Pro aminopeptidase